MESQKKIDGIKMMSWFFFPVALVQLSPWFGFRLVCREETMQSNTTILTDGTCQGVPGAYGDRLKTCAASAVNFTVGDFLDWQRGFIRGTSGKYNLYELFWGVNCQVYAKALYMRLTGVALETQIEWWGPAWKYTLFLLLSCCCGMCCAVILCLTYCCRCICCMAETCLCCCLGCYGRAGT